MADQIVTDNYFFKSGQPYIDIRAFGADPSLPSNEIPIQAAIDCMAATYGGGVVYMPPQIFPVTGTVIIKKAVRLVGAGRRATYLSGFAANVNTVIFDSSCIRGCGMENMSVQGYYNPNPALITSNAINILRNVPVNLSHVEAFYGSAALYTQGIDGHFFDCWFNGCLDSVISNGANWYNRTIFNGNGSCASQRNGFWQGVGYPGATSQENHFNMCDFSGNFVNSILLQNSFTATPSINIFNGCITSSPISILNNYFASFSGHEFGSPTIALGAAGGDVSIVGSLGFLTTLNLPDPRFHKAGNCNIV